MAVLGFGYPGALLAITTGVYLEGINQPKMVAICVVIANVMNAALNWLFIGGHFGFAAMGARGSALSTTIMRCALASILLGYAWRLNKKAREAGDGTHHDERAESRRAQWRLGLGAAVLVTPLIASELYGVHPLDPATFIAVTVVTLTVSIAACLIPARRAFKVDPMVALRYE